MCSSKYRTIYPCQDTGIDSYYFRQTLHGFSSDSDGTLTQHSQNLFKMDNRRNDKWQSMQHTRSLTFVFFLPVINKYQSSVRTASWRPDIWQSDRNLRNPQCQSLIWRKTGVKCWLRCQTQHLQSKVVYSEYELTFENWDVTVLSWWSCEGISFWTRLSA